MCGAEEHTNTAPHQGADPRQTTRQTDAVPERDAGRSGCDDRKRWKSCDQVYRGVSKILLTTRDSRFRRGAGEAREQRERRAREGGGTRTTTFENEPPRGARRWDMARHERAPGSWAPPHSWGEQQHQQAMPKRPQERGACCSVDMQYSVTTCVTTCDECPPAAVPDGRHRLLMGSPRVSCSRSRFSSTKEEEPKPNMRTQSRVEHLDESAKVKRIRL